MTDARAALNTSRFRDQRDVLHVTYEYGAGREDAAAGLNTQLHTFDDVNLAGSWASGYQVNFRRDFGFDPSRSTWAAHSAAATARARICRRRWG